MKIINTLGIICCLLTIGFCQSATGQKTASFKPGELWPDNNGIHINAHGGGILYDNGKYYWFGGHKTEGDGGNVANVANVGVHCYSSRVNA